MCFMEYYIEWEQQKEISKYFTSILEMQMRVSHKWLVCLKYKFDWHMLLLNDGNYKE